MSDRFVYSVWFRDLTTPPSDQDYEWPACFIIEASSSAEALEWGDHLSRNFSQRRQNERFLRSEVQDANLADEGLSSLPVIRAGYEAEDSEIGW